jgi:hypothetical protein
VLCQGETPVQRTWRKPEITAIAKSAVFLNDVAAASGDAQQPCWGKSLFVNDAHREYHAEGVILVTGYDFAILSADKRARWPYSVPLRATTRQRRS